MRDICFPRTANTVDGACRGTKSTQTPRLAPRVLQVGTADTAPTVLAVTTTRRKNQGHQRPRHTATQALPNASIAPPAQLLIRRAQHASTATPATTRATARRAKPAPLERQPVRQCIARTARKIYSVKATERSVHGVLMVQDQTTCTLDVQTARPDMPASGVCAPGVHQGKSRIQRLGIAQTARLALGLTAPTESGVSSALLAQNRTVQGPSAILVTPDATVQVACRVRSVIWAKNQTPTPLALALSAACHA